MRGQVIRRRHAKHEPRSGAATSGGGVECRARGGRRRRPGLIMFVTGLQEWNVAKGYLLALAPRLGGAVAAAVAAWIIASLAETALDRVGTRRQLDLDVTRLLSRSAKLVIFAFGVITSQANAPRQIQLALKLYW